MKKLKRINDANPVFCSRMAGNCIFKKVQVQITNRTTVKNEWKLNSADYNRSAKIIKKKSKSVQKIG